MDYFKKHPLLSGTLLLTGAGILSRGIGFFYRIFLSRTIGAEGMGIYQLIFPIYVLFTAVTSAGIQTGISKCCGGALARKDHSGARMYFTTGLFLSLVLSALAGCLLYSNASFISEKLLCEPRCAPLLQVIAISLPFGSIHSCINAWYYALGKAKIPSFSQLTEQLVRAFSSYMVYLIFLERYGKALPVIAAAGILAGEISSSLFTAIALFIHFQNPVYKISGKNTGNRYLPELISLTLPITANKVILTLLQSVEAVLIPSRLRSYGLTASQSLAAYGILTGMTLPFILFPNTLTGSMSTMVLPAIAGDQAAGKKDRILYKVERIIRSCLFLGILSGGIFFFFGEALGVIFYNNRDAGIFLQVLSFLCPFLYLFTTLNSILNGLGHTFLSLFINIAGILIRLGFILFAVPQTGLSGYMRGLILSNLAMAVFSLVVIHSMIPYHLCIKSWILRPVFYILVGCGWGLLFKHLLIPYSLHPFIIHVTAIGISIMIYTIFNMRKNL